jgi:uncharacterized protein (DUF433 family)
MCSEEGMAIMKTTAKTFIQAKPAIINRGRGPEIKGTRITVYDILDYSGLGWGAARIAAFFRLSSDQVIAASEYIKAHDALVQKEYKEIRNRCERGNSPQVRARLAAAHENFKLLLKNRKQKPLAGINRA